MCTTSDFHGKMIYIHGGFFAFFHIYINVYPRVSNFQTTNMIYCGIWPITHRIHGAGIYANIGGILMGSMLPYIAYMDPMGKVYHGTMAYPNALVHHHISQELWLFQLFKNVSTVDPSGERLRGRSGRSDHRPLEGVYHRNCKCFITNICLGYILY